MGWKTSNQEKNAFFIFFVKELQVTGVLAKEVRKNRFGMNRALVPNDYQPRDIPSE